MIAVHDTGLSVNGGSVICSAGCTGAFASSVDGADSTVLTVRIERVAEGATATVVWTATLAPTSAVRYGSTYNVVTNTTFESSPADDDDIAGRFYSLGEETDSVSTLPSSSNISYSSSFGSIDSGLLFKTEVLTILTNLYVPEGFGDVFVSITFDDPEFSVHSAFVSQFPADGIAGSGPLGNGSLSLGSVEFPFVSIQRSASASPSFDLLQVHLELLVEPDHTYDDQFVNVTVNVTIDGLTTLFNITAMIEEANVDSITSLSPTLADAGDILSYNVTLIRSDGDAFNFDLQSTVPISSKLMPASFDCPLCPDGTYTIVEAADLQDVFFSITEMRSSFPQVFSFLFNVQLLPESEVRWNTKYSINTSFTYDTAPMGGVNYFKNTELQNFTTTEPEQAIAYVSSNDAATVDPFTGLEELVTFGVDVDLPDGAGALIVSVQVASDPGRSANFVAVGGFVESMGSDITSVSLNEGDAATVSGDTITFDFGETTNAYTDDALAPARDRVRVNVTVYVPASDGGNVRGDTAIVVSRVTFDGTEIGSGSVSDQVTVVEPELNVSRTTTLPVGNDGASVDAGDVVRCCGTMSVESGSVTCTITGAGTEDCSGDVSFVGSTVELVLSRGLLVTEQVNLAWNGVVVQAIRPDENVTDVGNNTLTYSSLTEASARAYPAVVASYEMDSGSVLVVPAPTATLSFFGTSHSETLQNNVSVGEMVMIDVTVTLPEATTDIQVDFYISNGDFFVDDVLAIVYDGHLELESAQPLDSGFMQVGDENGVYLSFSSSLVNVFDNVADAAIPSTDTFVVRLYFNIEDSLVVQRGASFTMTAELRYDTKTVLIPTILPFLVIEPELDLDTFAIVARNPADTLSDAGDRIFMHYNVSHQPVSDSVAYDINLTMVLDDGLQVDSASVLCVLGCEPVVNELFFVTSDVDRQLFIHVPRLLLGDLLFITWEAVMLPGSAVRPDSTYQISASGHYDSAAVSFGSNMGRIAGLSPSVVSLDTDRPVISIDISFTSIDDSMPDEQFYIDEVVAFRTFITLPEGNSNLSLVYTFDDSYVTLLNATIVSVDSDISLGAPTLAGPGDLALLSDNNFVFVFGETANVPSEIPDSIDQVVVDAFVRLDSSKLNTVDRGSTLDYSVTLTADGYTTGDTFTSLGLQAPNLQSYDVIGSYSGDAGDNITYEYTLYHDGSSYAAQAYDVLLTVTFDPRSQIQPDYTVGCVTTDSATAGVTLASCLANGGRSADSIEHFADHLEIYVARLDLNERLHASVVGQVLQVVEPEDLLVHDIDYRWDTAPSANEFPGRENTGSNTFQTTIDGATLSYVGVTSADADTNTESAPYNVAIEEEITFDYILTMPESQTDVVTTLDIPINFEVLTATVHSFGSQISSTKAGAGDSLASSSDISFAGTTLTFDHGVVTNTFDQIGPNAGDQITYRIVLRLIDDPMNRGLQNEASPITRPIVTIDSDFNTASVSINALRQFRAVEPRLSVIISDDQAPYEPDAGDNVTFQVRVTHDMTHSQAQAYKIVIHVDVPTKYDVYDATVQTIVTAGAGGVFNKINSSYFTITVENLDNSASAEIYLVYVVRVDETVRPEEVIAASVRLDYASVPTSAAPLNGRQYNEGGLYPDVADVITATMDFVEIDLYLHNTSIVAETLGTDVNVHEQVVYRVSVTMPEVEANTNVLVTLPNGISYRTASVVHVGANIDTSLVAGTHVAQQSPYTILFDFGQFRNSPDNVEDSNDILIIEVVAQVDDDTFAVQGAVLTATARVTADATQYSDTQAVTVHEPDVILAATTDPLTPVDAGDVITFNFSVTYTGSPLSAAFDLYVRAELDDVIHVIPDGGELGSLGSSYTIAVDNRTITWYTPVFTPNDGVEYFSFRARMLQTVVPDHSNLITTMIDDFDSYPGEIWANTGRDYERTTDAPRVTVDRAVAVLQTLNSSLPETQTPPLLNIDEIVRLQLTATLPEGTMLVRFQFDEEEYSDWEFLDFDITIGSQIQCNASGAPVDSVAFQRDTRVFDFGACVNFYDQVEDDRDRIIVWIQAIPQDAPRNFNGESKGIHGTVYYSIGALDLTPLDPTMSILESYTISEPLLNLFASVEDTPVPADAGDVVQFGINLSHTPASLGPAYDITVNLTIHPDLVIENVTELQMNPDLTVSEDRRSIHMTLDLLTVDNGYLFVNFTARILQRILPDMASVTCITNSLHDSHANYSFRPDLPGRFYTLAHTSVPVVIDQPTLELSSYVSSDLATPEWAPTIHETFTTITFVTVPEVTLNLTVEVGFAGDPATFAYDFNYEYGENIICSVSPPAITATNTTLALDFGSCVNIYDNVADKKDIIAAYVVVSVDDDPRNTLGAQLPLAAEIRYTHQAYDVSTARREEHNVTIAEPQLLLTVDAMAMNPTDARDIVKYGFSLAHLPNSTASAHDMLVSIELHPYVEIVAIDVGAFADGYEQLGPQYLEVTIPTLTPNASRTWITIDAVVTDFIHPKAEGLVAAFNATYDSHRRDIFLRPGRPYVKAATGLAIPLAGPLVHMTNVSTSNPFTANLSVTVDEFIYQRLEYILPEGVSNYSLNISLPTEGVSLVSHNIFVGSNLACTDYHEQSLADLGGNVFGLDLGVCFNRPDNRRSSADRLWIDLIMLVLNEPINAVTRDLRVTTMLTYSGADNATLVADAYSLDFLVAEPTLSLDIDQFTDPFVQQGGPVDFEVRLTRSFGHDVSVNVTLGRFLVYEGTVYGSSSPRALTTTPVASGQETIVQYYFGNVSETEEVIFTVQARVEPDAPRGADINNSVALQYDSSFHVGRGRQYFDFATWNTLWVVYLDLNVTIEDIDDIESQLPNVTIAEQLQFTFAIAMRGVGDLLVQIELPRNPTTGVPMFSAVSAGVENIGLNVQPLPLGRDLFAFGEAEAVEENGIVTLDIGAIQNIVESVHVGTEDDLQVSIVVQVVDDDSVTYSGVSGDFAVAVTFVNLESNFETDINVVAPELVHTWTVSPASTLGDAGDLYELVHHIEHAPTSTWPAFVVVTRANLDASLEFQAVDNFANSSENGPSGTIAAFTGLEDVQLNTPRINLGETLDLRYTVRMSDAILLASTFSARCNLTYFTRPSVPLRTAHRSLALTVATREMPDVVLATPLSDSSPAPANGLVMGQAVSTNVTIELPEGRASGLEVTAHVPSVVDGRVHLALVDVQLRAAGATINVSEDNLMTIAASSDPSSDLFAGARRRRAAVNESLAANTLTLRFGEVTNFPDNVISSNDTLVVEFTAKLVDADLPNGQVLYLDAGSASDNSSASQRQSFVFYRPIVRVAHDFVQVNSTSGLRTMAFTATVTHESGSVVRAEEVLGAISVSGNASYTVQLQEAVNVSSFAPTAQVTAQVVVIVDTNATQPGSFMCFATSGSYTSPRVDSNSSVTTYNYSNQSCHEILILQSSTGDQPGNESFMQSALGLGVVIGVAAFIILALVLIALVWRRRKQKEEQTMRSRPSIHVLFDENRRGGPGSDTYADPNADDRKYLQPRIVGYDENGAPMYEEMPEGTAGLYGNASDGEHDYAAYTEGDHRSVKYEQAANDDHGDYGFAAKYDMGDIGDGDYQFAGRVKYDTGDAEEGDYNFAGGVKYDTGDADEGDYNFAGGVSGADGDGDYSFAGDVGQGRRRSKAGAGGDIYGLAGIDDEEDYAFANRNAAAGADFDDDDYGFANGVRAAGIDEDDYTFANRQVNNDDDDDDYAMANRRFVKSAGSHHRDGDSGEDDDVYAMARRKSSLMQRGGARRGDDDVVEDDDDDDDGDYAMARRKSSMLRAGKSAAVPVRSAGIDEEDEDEDYAMARRKSSLAAVAKTRGMPAPVSSEAQDDEDDYAMARQGRSTAKHAVAPRSASTGVAPVAEDEEDDYSMATRKAKAAAQDLDSEDEDYTFAHRHRDQEEEFDEANFDEEAGHIDDEPSEDPDAVTFKEPVPVSAARVDKKKKKKKHRRKGSNAPSETSESVAMSTLERQKTHEELEEMYSHVNRLKPTTGL
ncbi:uncharacterized protein MONBRDRAFT_37818 [Monosiga brevicollis MX1]|uniref:Uncharacterized protein n=1 Tax=Monosiga brevicollis TaxID=81824 RepID=A9V3L2_MONBE|nr:uncharacterized protein MONBRDRAFT_37818 [Monosiga brevicollis MX1]EDQ87932.1 predicted protein [Monosiga brevicollis MX1]|eukprot:XP_001747465.1 hypothetical protein [Monosiga brevicollis MX1]